MTKFKHMDYILLAVGAFVFLMASALSGVLNPYVEEWGFSAFTSFTTLAFQIGGGIAVIAALSGKRVFM
ncbi:MAG: hypothetical protein NWF01_06710 [Candidatus Bathyarchaeota archaeon]|nr:hypothetical protein [Candidatus Bathyarchaeota archaeon]